MRAWRISSLTRTIDAHGGSWLRSLHSIASRNSVFSFGNGGQGALGLGETSDSYIPESIEGLPQNISGVAAGHYHSLAWDEEGRLFSWGSADKSLSLMSLPCVPASGLLDNYRRNAEKQLGRSIQDTGTHGVDAAPGAVTGLPEMVLGAAASGVASFAIDAQGCVWSWGTSKRGQLGQGAGIAEAARPARLPGLEGITSVASGWGHALALREDGRVFAWGYPASGRLGDIFDRGSSQEDERTIMEACVWTSQEVSALSSTKALQVSCSLDSSLVLTAADEGSQILTFGDNSLGQLGRAADRGEGQNRSTAASWAVCDATDKPLSALSITAGLSHCIAVLASGQVAIWGWQHGLEDLPETLTRPHMVPGLALQPDYETLQSKLLAQRIHLGAGRVHSLLAAPSEALSFWDAAEGIDVSLKDEGWQGDALLSWGNGQNGRLGLGSSHRAVEPEVVADMEGYRILDVACGHDHSLILAAKM